MNLPKPGVSSPGRGRLAADPRPTPAKSLRRAPIRSVQRSISAACGRPIRTHSAPAASPSGTQPGGHAAPSKVVDQCPARCPRSGEPRRNAAISRILGARSRCAAGRPARTVVHKCESIHILRTSSPATNVGATASGIGPPRWRARGGAVMGSATAHLVGNVATEPKKSLDNPGHERVSFRVVATERRAGRRRRLDGRRPVRHHGGLLGRTRQGRGDQHQAGRPGDRHRQAGAAAATSRTARCSTRPS